MKAEINSENKLKFFAQYWGQDIMYSDMYGPCGDICSLTMKENSVENVSIDLKELSKIIDEDAKCVVYSGHTIEFLPEGWRTKGTKVIFNYKPKAVDYLRSRGYALPWMGLSVDEMVEAGWVKLK